MGELTEISWTDHTFNPWIGCQKVSPGCDNCYAESLSRRYYGILWGPEGERRRTSERYWRQPHRWNRNAQLNGGMARVFCASLADVFDNQAPPGAREELWRLIRDTASLQWLLLTKRPQNLAAMLPPGWPNGYGHVWLGVTAENQEEYERRWPLLAEAGAAVSFISYEPALGPLDLSTHEAKPGWLIWGGESGPGARAPQPDWIRQIVRQCDEYQVPCFAKQWGSYAANPLVTEADQTVEKARSDDPPANGKGGAKLDRKIRRDFPPATPALPDAEKTPSATQKG